MAKSETKFALPKKIDGYLGTLSRLYEKTKKQLLQEIVVNAAVSVHEAWDYDNWDGGTYGHAVTLLIPEDS